MLEGTNRERGGHERNAGGDRVGAEGGDNAKATSNQPIAPQNTGVDL